MSRMNVEYFIAQRLSAATSLLKNRVMVRVAITAVAASVAVMIIAICVMSGFKSQITDKITGFGSHALVTGYGHSGDLTGSPIKSNQPLIKELQSLPFVSSIAPYSQRSGVIVNGEGIQGVMLKGIGCDYDLSFFKSNLKQGEIPDLCAEEKSKEIVISSSLASLMKLKPGDKVEMMFLDNPPRRDRFTVGGIYSTGLSEMDMSLVLTDIRNVSRLNNYGDSLVTGFEVLFNDFAQSDAYSDILYQKVEGGYGDNISYGDPVVVTTKQSYEALFDWLELQDVNIAIIISIMITVSTFNMIAMMLILILEKSSTIGILRSLGMSVASLQKLFVIRTAFIVAKGVAIGTVLGVGLCFIQQFTGVVKLPQSGYFLTQVPILIEPVNVVIISLGSFAAIVMLQFIPTMIISKMSIHTTIKYRS